MFAICKSGVPQYRLFLTAENLRNAAESLQPQSQKAWMYLSRDVSHVQS